MISIAHCTHHKLCHRPCQLLVWIFLPYCFCPLQHFQQLTHKIFLRSQCAQAFLCWPLQIHRHAISQLHRMVQLFIFYAWHNFEVNVTSVSLAITNNVNGIDNFVLCGHTTLDDFEREKDSLYSICPLQYIECSSHLIR